ncbi:unnamed protein product [Rotaria sp. Silwood2]|nr:unnamed protein product [Rotaria sp. Silwood2]
MVRTYKTLACIDRYAICSTSIRYRSFSQSKAAIYIIISCALFWSPAIIFFVWARTIQNGSCNIFNEIYLMVYTIYYMIFAGILPPLLMTICTILVMQTLRNLRSRVQPTRHNGGNNQSINIIRKRDRNLMKIVFTEVMFYVITTIPYSIYLIYKVTTDSLIKS